MQHTARVSIVQSGARVHANPHPELAQSLRRWIGAQRFIFSAKLEEERLFAAQRRMVLRDHPGALVTTPLDRLCGQFKDDELMPWLSEVPSQVLREGTYRWFNAKQRQLKGLAEAPRKRNRRNFNSVLLCSELFSFTKVKAGAHHLFLGNKKFPLGELSFKAHREFTTPTMLSISVTGVGRRSKWFVSFSYEHEVDVVGGVLGEPHELAYELNLLGDEDLREFTLGVDRNVADNCVATSAADFYMPHAAQLERIARKAVGAKRQQRRLARTLKDSRNRRKVAARIASTHAYKAEVLRDFAHKTSLALVESGAKPISFEDLKVVNMVRRPKAKSEVRHDGSVRWLRNGARAKAGLNRSILSSAWGRILAFKKYKAARRNVLVAAVRPHHSSQECYQCWHTHPENRKAASFLCQRCGYAEHADTNASKDIDARGVKLLRSGELEKPPKTKRRVAVKRRPQEFAGPERPEMSVERLQDAAAGLTTMLVAQDASKQKASTARLDAPTTAPPGV
jgi:putative transposase